MEREGGSSHGRTNRIHTQREGGSSRHGMTRPPERLGALREPKPWEPPQRPNPDGGRTDAGGGEGTKTHPPPKPTGSSRPMAETAQRHRAPRRWRTRRRRGGRRSEPAARGARQHTPSERLRLRRWEAQSPRGPHRLRRRATTALGTRPHTPSARIRLRCREAQSGRGRLRPVETHRGRRGGTKPPGERERRRTQPTRRRRRGPPPNGRARLTRAAEEGGKGAGEPPTISARPWRAARERGGDPREAQRGNPREGGH